MIKTVINEVRLAWRLLTDRRVPLWTKLIPLAAAAYIVSPVDFIPDIIPVLGQLDDIGILLAGLRAFREVVPVELLEEHLHHIQPGNNDPEVIEVHDYTVKQKRN
jgi:uncharacterized membrane protein YkvA (DUF1232 family)